MDSADSFESLFKQAVFAIDGGEVSLLKRLLDEHPEVATRRLYSPGNWLTEQIGDALKGFFKDPYLLWFVSEDPVRNNTLPSNIAEIAKIIIETARKQGTSNFQEQLDYGIRLVAWSWVARENGAQIDLLNVMVDSGASTGGVSDDALVNGNFAAAEHLVKRGAKLTLSTALCLEKWMEAEKLMSTASYDEKQFGLVLAALLVKTEAVARLIRHGVNINEPSRGLYSHGTPLHHAVWSGSLDTVKLLVEAGADLETRDTLFDGTPLGWAEYGKRDEVADYLRSLKKG